VILAKNRDAVLTRCGFGQGFGNIALFRTSYSCEFQAVGERIVPVSMSSAIFNALARSKLLRDVERAFRDATGLSLKLVPSIEPKRRLAIGKNENPFCALMSQRIGACETCVEVQREMQRRLSRKLSSQEICCFAGMIELAVPVIVGGQHAATLLGGQVFRQKPGRRQFARIARQVRSRGMHSSLSQLRQAYFQTPVVSAKQLEGAMRLLTILATQLAESGHRNLLAAQKHEPPSVTAAKHFMHAHAGERITLRQTAAHVHVSRHYFCKLFKQATGLTFTEFVARVRVQKAKALLNDRSISITNVADGAGFNSISQFNRVFRRYSGHSPTAYRAEFLRAAGAR
jgi:AraC-like DNA-binding protein